MSQKYCMKCGGINEFDANFCKKCGNSFNITRPVEARTEEKPIIKRGRKKKEIHVHATPKEAEASLIETNGKGLTIRLPENDEDDGPSLDYVPEVTELQIEELETDSIKGITFGQLIEEANREKAHKAKT